MGGWARSAASNAARPTIHRGGQKERLPEIGGRINPEDVVRKARGETPEARVTRESLDAMKAAGLLVFGTDAPAEGFRLFRNNVGSAMVTPPGGGKAWPLKYGIIGECDFIGRIVPFGIWCSLEMKAPGEQPKPHQWTKIHQARADGGWADYSDRAERTVALVRQAMEWARGRVRA
jgi:hypothetical protein